MSKGQEIIGKFNASEKSEVDLIEEYGKDQRRKATAITNVEQGVMWAIKSLF